MFTPQNLEVRFFNSNEWHRWLISELANENNFGSYVLFEREPRQYKLAFGLILKRASKVHYVISNASGISFGGLQPPILTSLREAVFKHKYKGLIIVDIDPNLRKEIKGMKNQTENEPDQLKAVLSLNKVLDNVLYKICEHYDQAN